jgi:hypothetical protein
MNSKLNVLQAVVCLMKALKINVGELFTKAETAALESGRPGYSEQSVRR